MEVYEFQTREMIFVSIGHIASVQGLLQAVELFDEDIFEILEAVMCHASCNWDQNEGFRGQRNRSPNMQFENFSCLDAFTINRTASVSTPVSVNAPVYIAVLAGSRWVEICCIESWNDGSWGVFVDWKPVYKVETSSLLYLRALGMYQDDLRRMHMKQVFVPES